MGGLTARGKIIRMIVEHEKWEVGWWKGKQVPGSAFRVGGRAVFPHGQCTVAAFADFD
jgi:hypothetical protein